MTVSVVARQGVRPVSAPNQEHDPEGELLAPEDVLRLKDVDWAEFEADTLVEVTTLSQRLVGQVQAVQLRAIAELRRRRGCERETGDEVGWRWRPVRTSAPPTPASSSVSAATTG
ncbi:MAG: hypothetical protein GEV04_10515 [Actinophytocola sp.]|nr:hypothetical protein [Actinophytocola sp.]